MTDNSKCMDKMLQSKKKYDIGTNFFKMEKGTKKTSGHDVLKGTKVTMGPNVSIFMGVMDIKYIRTKCNLGTKCHTVGLAKNAGGGMFTCDILSLKSVLNRIRTT
jgi:hypothetical protein